MTDAPFSSELGMLTDLARAMCLAPFLDQQDDPGTEGAANELLLDVQKMKADLDVVLTDEVRADLVQLIQHFEDNRTQYREAVVRWVDLLDDIAFYVENKHGDHTGPLKMREVRAALYYILKGFLGDTGLPTLPPWMRPILVEVVVRATVEFLVTLDHPMSESPELWRDASQVGTDRKTAWKKTKARIGTWWEKWSERIVARLIAFLVPPPSLSGPLRKDVDAIITRWAARNQLTGSLPFERVTKPVVDTALWIGRHSDQVKSAIDAVALAVHETANLSHLDSQQRLAVLKDAAVIMFQDLGFSGPIFETVVRFAFDLSADAMQHLFQKRGLFAESA